MFARTWGFESLLGHYLDVKGNSGSGSERHEPSRLSLGKRGVSRQQSRPSCPDRGGSGGRCTGPQSYCPSLPAPAAITRATDRLLAILDAELTMEDVRTMAPARRRKLASLLHSLVAAGRTSAPHRGTATRQERGQAM